LKSLTVVYLKKGLWVNEKVIYFESTAKDYGVGYLLQYRVNEIDGIMEHFQMKRW